MANCRKIKLIFNPSVPLLRILGVIFYIGLVYFSANLLYDQGEKIIYNPSVVLLIAFYLIVFYAVIVSLLKGLMNEIQFVRLECNSLKITNPTLFKENVVPLKDIDRIHKSQKRYGRGYIDSLVIRTKSGQVFELPKHHYFNFDKFIDDLKEIKLPHKI